MKLGVWERVYLSMRKRVLRRMRLIAFWQRVKMHGRRCRRPLLRRAERIVREGV